MTGPTPDDPAQRFAALAGEFAGTPGVLLPDDAGGRRFGASALRVNGSIFAMLTAGALVVKLPRDRVAALITQGVGAPFDAGKARPMREWLRVTADDPATWRAVSREALAFVAARTTRDAAAP